MVQPQLEDAFGNVAKGNWANNERIRTLDASWQDFPNFLRRIA